MQRIIVLLVGLLAQVLGIEADQSQWSELGVATLFVWGSVEMLRPVLFKNLQGVSVNVFAGVVGIGIGIVFGLGQIITGTVFDWAVFGIQATLFATIGDLLAKKASGKALGGQAPTP